MVEILKFWDPASMDGSPPPAKYPDFLHRIFSPAAAVNRAFHAAARAELPPLLTFTIGERYVFPPPGMTALEYQKGPTTAFRPPWRSSSTPRPKTCRRFVVLPFARQSTQCETTPVRLIKSSPLPD